MKSLVLMLALFAVACDRGGANSAMNQRGTRRSTQPSATAPATPAALRIVTLGDSLAYGTGDEQDSGIAGRLKVELQQRGVSSVTTVNLGVNGAQTNELLARLKQPRIQSQLAEADAIVLSIGANDLFRTPAAREESLRNPLAVAERILERLQTIVTELHRLNPAARIFILGGYNPVPTHSYSSLINQYLGLWDQSLAGAFEDDPLVAIVRMDDIVTPKRLSRYDHFHPSGSAYEEASKRIATMLLQPAD